MEDEKNKLDGLGLAHGPTTGCSDQINQQFASLV